ncbi:ArgJ-like domain-containing protein [Pisolithus marmoratus]|nr:ArgJ-like domain-containing protein [Pisolithus marmoratus]
MGDKLTTFTLDLAKPVVRDGEGATKFVELSIESAALCKDAHCIVSAISTYVLVKTALYGEDVKYNYPSRPYITRAFFPRLGSHPLYTGSATLSTPLDPSWHGHRRYWDMTSFGIVVDLGLGYRRNRETRHWTCDFSYECVQVNGDYRS